jgi:hypothetical protein
MGKSNYQKIRKTVEESYKRLGVIACPALGDELIHFNNVGINHLIRKGKKIRPISDQIRRFKLLLDAPTILRNGSLTEYRIVKGSKDVQFWTISCTIKTMIINVVIVQVGNGQKNFLSVTKKN